MNLNALALFFLVGTALLAADDPSLPAATGTERTQNVISAQLSIILSEARETQMKPMQRTIGDITRATHLAEDRLKLLHIAAHGAVDDNIKPMRERLLKDAEARIKGLPPNAVVNVLKGMRDRYGSTSATKQPLWIESVKSLLTSEELAQWQRVVRERNAYRSRAYAELLILHVRKEAGLSPEQTQKMRPLLEKATSDYLPDLSMWSGGDDGDMYSGYLYALILGAPEKEVRAVLTPAQWDKWRASAGEGGEIWSSIQSAHERRLKEESLNP